MKFDIYTDSGGKYRWRLVAGNGQTVASSGEAFDSKSNARRAAENVRDQAASSIVAEPALARGQDRDDRAHRGATRHLLEREWSALREQEMEAGSYYSPEGDIVYLHVRSSERVRTEELDWGLRDYDVESGELAGLEVWDASKVLPCELVESLPRLEGRSGVVITREDLAKRQLA